ncbi:hypothetical protein Zmor_001240 [Zophobas morio]|uniref:Uncharacterized protein n=1 Tax=Zophobas morio TaxID=2755281 RepID=A0AA38MP51_9CUCU|nr:hypothetical protein Zmor_001240 [Zophobas morio]
MFFRAIFNQKNVKFGMVLGAYAALFRGSLFLFEKSNCYKETTNVALAGFIAGISYYIKPTINILAIATVTVIQILLKENFKGTKSTKLVLIMLIYMFSNGILFQNRFIAPITCPKYYVNMLQMASQQLIDEIYHRLINKYLKT